MLIRSQGKGSLVKFENIVININGINGKEIICWSQMNTGEDEYISLGYYSTKEKALKVLDMIQEAYKNYEKYRALLMGFNYATTITKSDSISTETLCTVEKVLKESSVFQMPTDSEVDV